jgi:predicted extracellular nuclease
MQTLKLNNQLQYLIALLFIVQFSSCAQSQDTDAPRNGEAIRIGFYNVENLFDPENDSLRNDDAFTPEGNYRWTPHRLNEKVKALTKVIRHLGGWEPIEVLGLCEIENRYVIERLINHPTLKNAGYRIAHFESPDRRGIDVGAIYRPEYFNLLHQQAIAVVRDDLPEFRTRDILYLKGLSLQDTLHIFFNHWPSRYGGQQKSEPSRIAAALRLRTFVDSITSINPLANIVIMGDFNDEWDNQSVRKTLGADILEANTDLVNLMAAMNPDMGTHRYQGRWAYLDQAIVSRHLLDKQNSLQVKNHRAEVFQPDYLLEDDDKYPGKKPFRMFIGMKYQGGFSDHLPIYIDIITNK